MPTNCQRNAPIRSRREFLARAGAGFGLLPLSYLSQRQAAAATASNPFAPKAPHFRVKAKSVIYLFMHGGPSHVDSFDPKPLLQKLDGQKMPESMGKVMLQFTNASEAPLMASRRAFRPRGASGLEISDLFENTAAFADDVAVVRSCYHDGFTHSNALNWMNTGWPRLGRPSLGAWVVYGLGCEADNLPAYVVMLEGSIKAGPPAYGAGFLPAMYQGTTLRSEGVPILNIRRPGAIDEAEQREMLDLMRRLNERHMETRSDDSSLSARIESYELAFRMQMAAPELTDLTKESDATRKLYGMDDPVTADYGTRCLLARRMVERGVRFVQLYSGSGNGNDWDGHNQCDKNHTGMARKVDKPIAGLLADLKSRGLLDSTLVVWGGEFGRTPMTDGNANGGYGGGRDHNPYGFSVWLAGGGVKGGRAIGATDEIGFRAAQEPIHMHDLHATFLGLMGLDHKRLTYFVQGRNFRLTDVGGEMDLSKRLLEG